MSTTLIGNFNTQYCTQGPIFTLYSVSNTNDIKNKTLILVPCSLRPHLPWKLTSNLDMKRSQRLVHWMKRISTTTITLENMHKADLIFSITVWFQTKIRRLLSQKTKWKNNMKNYSAKIKIEPSENVDKPKHKSFCWILSRAELCIFIDSLITIGIVYNKLE